VIKMCKVLFLYVANKYDQYILKCIIPSE